MGFSHVKIWKCCFHIHFHVVLDDFPVAAYRYLDEFRFERGVWLEVKRT